MYIYFTHTYIFHIYVYVYVCCVKNECIAKETNLSPKSCNLDINLLCSKVREIVLKGFCDNCNGICFTLSSFNTPALCQSAYVRWRTVWIQENTSSQHFITATSITANLPAKRKVKMVISTHTNSTKSWF
jgi:hypothetical protein